MCDHDYCYAFFVEVSLTISIISFAVLESMLPVGRQQQESRLFASARAMLLAAADPR